jgi:hypothetical protein
MTWQVATPEVTFQYSDLDGFNPPVTDILEVEFGQFGVPYLHTATFDFTLRDERVVYLAATVWAEENYPGKWFAEWTGDEPMPSLPDHLGDRLPVN